MRETDVLFKMFFTVVVVVVVLSTEIAAIYKRFLLNIICWTYLKIKYFQGERGGARIEKRAGDGRLAALSPIFTSRAHFSET